MIGSWVLLPMKTTEISPIGFGFSFLEEGKTYKAIVYKDGKDAHWDDNPLSFEIEELEITSEMQKTFHLAAGGGLAISLK
jgi:hypothetical protein